jgi:hypothetical protein
MEEMIILKMQKICKIVNIVEGIGIEREEMIVVQVVMIEVMMIVTAVVMIITVVMVVVTTENEEIVEVGKSDLVEPRSNFLHS